jgi:predicted membrane protein
MRNRNVNRSMHSQLIVGVLVIAMGVLFLLDNLDIVDFHRAISFWPMVFIVVGLIKLFDTSRPNYLMGGVFIAIGAVMIANRLGFFYVSLHTFWPLLLIVVGGMVMVRAFERGRHRDSIGAADKDAMPMGAAWNPADAANAKQQASTDDVVDITAILGGFERSITSQKFRGGDVTAILGGCALDMRNASIENEAVLDVFAFMGGITIKVPTDWTVVMHGTPILGGFEEKTVRQAGPKRLVVTGYAIMGGIEVRN